jgi:hypothetical protein
MYHLALVTELRKDRDSYGLRHAVTQHAARFVAVLAELHDVPWEQRPNHVALVDESGSDQLLALLVPRVCGEAGPHIDTAIRPGVVSAISELTENVARKTPVRVGDPLIDDELFCFLYRVFFADTITQFLTSVIAAKLNVAVPVLLLIDPTGQVSQYIGGWIAEAIPTPCEEKSKNDSKDPISTIAQGMVEDTFDRWIDSAGVMR